MSIADPFRQRVERSDQLLRINVVTKPAHDERRYPRICRRQIFFWCGHGRPLPSLRKMFCSTASFRFGGNDAKDATYLVWPVRIQNGYSRRQRDVNRSVADYSGLRKRQRRVGGVE